MNNAMNIGDKVYAAGKYHGYGVGIIEGTILDINGVNVRVRWWNGEIHTTDIKMLWK